jgi:hypothetical protein
VFEENQGFGKGTKLKLPVNTAAAALISVSRKFPTTVLVSLSLFLQIPTNTLLPPHPPPLPGLETDRRIRLMKLNHEITDGEAI